MRYLRKAAREGPLAFARSLARFPHRHPFWIAGTVFGVAAVLGILGYYETNREVTHVNQSVTRIEAASPCLTYGPRSELCKESFEKAVLTITHPEACAILRKAGLEVVECAHARLRQEHIRHQERTRSKGVVDANGHAPSSQPSPHGGSGDNGTSGGTHGGTKKPPKPHQPQHEAEYEPSPVDNGTDTTPAETSPESHPGSGVTSTSEAPPGLIGNPGGAVGKAACDATEVVNQVVGVPVCSK